MEDVFSRALDSLSEDKEVKSCFSSIIESSYDAIIVESVDGKVLDWNKAAEKIYGYSSNEIIGRSIFNIIPENKRSQFEDMLTKIKKGEKIKNFITERIRKNGDKVFLSAVVTPIRDENDKVVASLSIVRDVTDFKTMAMELNESNERLKDFIESMPTLIYLKDRDTKNIILSKKFSEILNSPLEELTGKTNEEIWGKKLGDKITQSDMKALELGRGEFIEEEDVININGSSRDYITYKFPIHQADGKSFVGGISLDVTKSKEYEKRLKSNYEELSELHNELSNAEKELREQYNALKESQKLVEISERRHQLAAEGSNDGIWDIDMINKKIFLSDKCKEIFSIDSERNNFSISECKNYIYKKNYLKALNKLKSYLKDKENLYSDEIKITNNNEDKYIYCRGKALWDENGKAIYIAGSVTDITERKKYQKIIENLAYTSEVTGLYNRTYAMNKFPDLLKDLEADNAKAALVFVDMDNFKAINDTLGHFAGDKFLRKVSNEFRNILKTNYYACHLGGDEFLFLLTEVKNKAEVERFAKKLLNIFKKPFSLNGQKIYYITASIGVTMMPDYGYDIQTLFNYSDDAMYYAKRNGKNKYIFYTDKMESTIYEEAKLLNELKIALHNNEFKVFYQPKVKVDTKEIIGMEALVRWQKEDGTMVPPSKFINFAEEKGIIVPIGEYVMKTSCLQNREWMDRGFKPVRVAVNLSACQLADEKVFCKIEDILKETGLPPSCLEVEITETMIIKNFEASIITLNKLKDRGIKISLDDFGTGYSSLSYLKQLPINSVKIDKSFIDNITVDLKERFVVNSVINLVHGLGLTVVAEGVETEEQFLLLKELGCDEIQGYYFSKPLSLEEFEKIM